jgi:vacuolar protein sorting-associated protein 52
MIYSLRLIMQRRRIPILDPFFDRLSLLLWPRFQQILDANIKSIKTAHYKRLGPVDLSPHYVSRRFAELVASINSLQQSSSLRSLSAGESHSVFELYYYHELMMMLHSGH